MNTRDAGREGSMWEVLPLGPGDVLFLEAATSEREEIF